MNIETAKELKALHIGYTDWATMQVIYSRYNKQDKLKEHLDDAENWVNNGIPEEEMKQIEKRIHLYGHSEADLARIKYRLEYVAEKPSTNQKIIEVINFVHTL